MEIFRYSTDAYGQQVLAGISWDLLWVFITISSIIIIGHFIYKLMQKPEE